MVVAGAKVSKSCVLQELADYVNEKCGTKWHKEKARETLRSYKDTYKKVKNQFEDVSGGKFCLTEDELARGLTIDKKLEKLCYGYFRMDQLFGNKQNVKPYSTIGTGLSVLIDAIGSDSEDDEGVASALAAVEGVAVEDVGNQVNDCEVPADTTLNITPPQISTTKKGKKDSSQVPGDLRDLCSSTVKEHAMN